jgi:hypothetical protein
MALNVTGRKSSATIGASAKNINGVWSVTGSSLDDGPVSLNWIEGVGVVRFILALIAILLAVNAQPDGSCGSFVDSRHRSVINFAPVVGFVEVRSRDADLCDVLTKGYPPSVATVAYFVTRQDWQLHLKDKRQGFTQYLIGQRGHRWSRDEFLEFKNRVRSNLGTVSDHTDLPAIVESLGRASLGVTAESARTAWALLAHGRSFDRSWSQALPAPAM